MSHHPLPTDHYPLKLGIATSLITPPIGARLMGYAERIGGSTGIADELVLQTVAFQSGDTRSLLIAADLVGLAEYFYDRLIQQFQQRFNLPPQSVLMIASHNHSGPVIPYSFMDMGKADQDYLNRLEATILSDAALALSRLDGDYRLTQTAARVAFGINRRLPNASGEIEMLPNPAAPRDDQAIILQFQDTASPRRLVLFNYACHADTLGSTSNIITAEFPGAARRFIETALPETTAIYLPGCEAEINPNVTDERGEFFGTYADVLRLGQELGDGVLAALETAPPALLDPTLDCHLTDIFLPLSEIPPLEHFQKMAATDYSQRPPWEPDWAAFARYLLDDPAARLRPDVPVRLTAWRLAENITLLGIGAEASVEYGLQIQRMFTGQTILPIGYANGVVAYLSTRQQILEGGYEVELGNVWCNHPAPFALESEQVLLDGIRNFLSTP